MKTEKKKESKHNKHSMRRFNIIALVMLAFYTSFMAYVLLGFKTEDTSLLNEEVYSFNDNWILNTDDTQSPITLPFSVDGNMKGNQKNIWLIPDTSQGGIQESHIPAQTEGMDISGEAVDGLMGPGGGTQKPKMTEEAAASGQGMSPEPKDENKPSSDDTEAMQQMIVFENTIPEEYKGLTLAIVCSGKQFRVRIDDVILYDGLEEQTTSFAGNQGSTLTFVNIPEDMQQGKVYIELPEKQRFFLKDISVSKRDTAVLQLIVDNLLTLIFCITMIVAGAVLFLLTAIQRASRQSTNGMLYLGIYSLYAVLHFLLQTQVISIFYGNQTVILTLYHICFLEMPFLLLMYYEGNFPKKFHKRFVLLLWVSVFNGLQQPIFQVAGITDFQVMQFVTYILTLVTLLVALWCLIGMAREQFAKKIIVESLVVLFMLACYAGDFVEVSVLHTQEMGRYSLYSTTLFCLAMMISNILRVSQGYSASIMENERLLKHEVEIMEEQNKKLLEANNKAEEARMEAEAANEAKGKFLANMSHEIRTPINAVLGMNAMILRESGDSQIKEYAMDIDSAGNNLLSLINDILDFSKIDSGKMEIVEAEYDLSSLLNDIINMISGRAKAKDLQLNVLIDENLPSRLYGDDVRIRQVIVNILTNAVKYTPEGSVTFRVSGKMAKDKVILHVEVEDTGIGIKPEDIQKLFVEFERIEEQRNRNIEGTGLGMNITTQLLLLMGSKLEVESEYGKGSKFFFDIEQKIVSTEPIGDLEERIHQQAQDFDYEASFIAPDAHVLVVDDNATNRKVFRNLLKETEIQIDEAEGGKVCLEMVSQKHYDIIFLDHMMPEMDGIQTLEHMKEMDDYPSKGSPVIALTANAITGAREMYLSKGFDSFLSKPILPDKLEKLIREMLPKELLKAGEAKPKQDINKAGEGSQKELPEIDGIDWSYGLLHLPNQELLLETAEQFYKTINSDADFLQNCYDSEDWEAYRIRVHAMKSSAALIGAASISGVAKLLEYAARDMKIDVIRGIHDAFLEEWRSYKERMKELFEEDEPKQEVSDSSVILMYLGLLENAMEELDIDASDAAMEELSKYQYSEEQQVLMDQLETAVASLDSDGTAEVIEKLKGLLG